MTFKKSLDSTLISVMTAYSILIIDSSSFRVEVLPDFRVNGNISKALNVSVHLASLLLNLGSRKRVLAFYYL